MRMQALSAVSGVPTSTIKFYLRERFLPAGRPTARNQAHYDDTHVQRLILLRVLTQVGRLPLATVKEIVELLDSPYRYPATMCASLVAPTVSVEQLTATAAELGIPEHLLNLGEYRLAAKLMKDSEDAMCANLEDELGPLIAAVLGDALIVALRHELRTEGAVR